MNKIYHILRYEIITTLSRKSFLFVVFGAPILAVFIFFIISQINKGKSSTLGESKESPGKSDGLKVEGYVDYSGLIEEIPDDAPKGVLISYPDENSCKDNLSSGTISAYYVIPEDYLETGDLIYMNPHYSPSVSRGQSWVMTRTISANLLGNDPASVEKFRHVMNLKEKPLAPIKKSREPEASSFAMPYATALIFVMILMTSSSLLLHSVTEEKKNMVMEVLLSSVTPRQILTGKILGLGIVGLMQGAFWAGAGFSILSLRGGAQQVSFGFTHSIFILGWIIVSFIFGYFLYASMMAGLGAMSPNMKEASQATFLVIWPIILCLSLSGYLIPNAHGSVAVFLSLFPLTSPIVMLMRLVVGGVPWWQPVLALFLLAFAAILVVRSVARMFQASLLLSGQPMSARRYYRALLGRG
ncbi:ABC transporter permease [Candidatus Sumerlaeota bacterium]|nr:ABC transporter permease [Candidatus Sumerlaeota bacterium]